MLSTPAPLSVEMSTLVTLLMVPGAQVPLVAVCRCAGAVGDGAQVPLVAVRRCAGAVGDGEAAVAVVDPKIRGARGAAVVVVSGRRGAWPMQWLQWRR